jgi:MraZ protein
VEKFGGRTVFIGQFDHALDEKGRVSIPVQFREELQRQGHNRLYITNHVVVRERCLALYPPKQWEELIERIREKSRTDPETELPEIFYIGRAHQVELDRQGRILIPAKLRDFAHIERDVTFSAQIDYLQLWSRATLERLDAVANKLADEDPKFMAKLR